MVGYYYTLLGDHYHCFELKSFRVIRQWTEASVVVLYVSGTLGVEHRCDCGQLFNSAALLTRHTSLAHTPPRIRRRRSPPPEPSAKPARNSEQAKTNQPNVRSESSNSKPTRKSSAKSDTPETRKSIKLEQSTVLSSAKPKRNAAHRGVPVPAKMRKLMMKIAK